MAQCEQNLYPFITSTEDDGGASSIRIISSDEPTSHNDGDNDSLMGRVELTIDTIALSEAEKSNLHKDTVYNRMPPIDILIFGRSGIGKSCLLRAITDNPDIQVSAKLDQSTQKLESWTKKIGKSTFRFWDTRGIDSWSASNDIPNLFSEIKQKNIQPLFIIYCASGSGRVNSEVVTKILNNLRDVKTPIAYVVTNIYSHSDSQLLGQIDGGLEIMNEVFCSHPVQKNKYYYEYDVLVNGTGTVVRDGKGILICVNSESFSSALTNTNKPKLNLYELMSFIGNNLDDENFARFVALTLNNRGFWERISDDFMTKLYQCRDKLTEYGITFRDFIWNQWSILFPLKNTE